MWYLSWCSLSTVLAFIPHQVRWRLTAAGLTGRPFTLLHLLAHNTLIWDVKGQVVKNAFWYVYRCIFPQKIVVLNCLAFYSWKVKHLKTSIVWQDNMASPKALIIWRCEQLKVDVYVPLPWRLTVGTSLKKKCHIVTHVFVSDNYSVIMVVIWPNVAHCSC